MTPVPHSREMTSDEIRQIARDAAVQDVQKTFFLIGIDTTDRDALDAVQADRAYLRRLRTISETRSTSLRTALIGAGCSLVVTVLGAYALGLLHLGGKAWPP